MLADKRTQTAFEAFFLDLEPRLWRALSAGFGPDVGREATADALAYAWEHWSRVSSMENPAGYLFRVGQNAARKTKGRRPASLAPAARHEAEFEPELAAAVAELPERQRLVVGLIHGYGWTFSEVADVAGLTKSSVQTHERRGMRSLRKKLGVDE